jgi:hypothetical protein
MHHDQSSVHLGSPACQHELLRHGSRGRRLSSTYRMLIQIFSAIDASDQRRPRALGKRHGRRPTAPSYLLRNCELQLEAAATAVTEEWRGEIRDDGG